MKNKKNFIIGIIIGILIFSITVYAKTLINSSEVIYDNENSKLSSTNVQGAVDELYDNLEKNLNPNDETIHLVNLYHNHVINGYGENVNINYTIPENVGYLIIYVGRFMANATFSYVTLSGDGYIKNIKSIKNAQGSRTPYSYTNILYIKVSPGKTVNIKTNDTNLNSSIGNYSTSIMVAY